VIVVKVFDVVFLDYNGCRLKQEFICLSKEDVESELSEYYGWGNTKIVSIKERSK